jgi:hypothetical protein
MSGGEGEHYFDLEQWPWYECVQRLLRTARIQKSGKGMRIRRVKVEGVDKGRKCERERKTRERARKTGRVSERGRERDREIEKRERESERAREEERKSVCVCERETNRERKLTS